jgi:ribonucleoside-diphosphate reductase beta chain
VEIDSNIFNTEKKDYTSPSILLGEQQGLFDTVNKVYPKIWKLYKTCKSLDWDESEFNYSSCLSDFKSCSKDTYEAMIRTLAWQWEADTVAARSLVNILSSVITSSEAWAAEQRISDQEVVHAATYSEIVRNSFDDPRKVLDEILAVSQSLERMETVSRVFSEAYKATHEYALGMIPNDQDLYNKVFMVYCTVLAMERIQFMSSFAVTFAICDTGLFQPIGKAVQKIAQDELEVHVDYRKAVIDYEMKTERGILAYEQCLPKINEMVNEVVETELKWNNYLFSEGRSLIGLNESVLSQWSLFCAKDIYNYFKIQSEHTLPRKNPLRFMESWLNIGKTQSSPQEQDNAQYKVGIMRRDDEEKSFDFDF